MSGTDAFARRLLDWHARCGRHDLPWQRNRTAYTIWIAEIMLQQTQVATVIPYFQRFTSRFPSLGSLAEAGLDEVLAAWAGLGYYARARNLHRSARVVGERFGGELPESFDALRLLPGIGRSTAGAILAQAKGMRFPILDGNARRVLARFHAVDGWPGEREVERTLWALAERHTPSERVADYTQAIMDLGAGICVRRVPRCRQCPVAETCAAHRQGIEERLPQPRPRRPRPLRRTAALVIQDAAGRVLLERRPERGIWGGLFSVPELPAGDIAREWCERHLGVLPAEETPMPAIKHAFTHFDLVIEPVLLRLSADCRAVVDSANLLWYKAAARPAIGLAAPIRALLDAVCAGAPEGSRRAGPTASAGTACQASTVPGMEHGQKKRGETEWAGPSTVSCSARRPRASSARRIRASSGAGSTRTSRTSRGSAGSRTRPC